MSDFGKEFAADGSCINDQNRPEGAEVVDDALSNTDDESIDVDPQLLADSSDLYYDLGTTQLKNYIELHMYKPGPDGKYRLRSGHVFDDVDHFRRVLSEVMVDKGFEITKCTMSVGDFTANARLMTVRGMWWGEQLEVKVDL